MGDAKVMIDINNEEAFRGYVVSKLEIITERVEKTEEKVGKIESSMITPEICGIDKVKSTLFGNGKEGLVIEVKKLKLSHKIKSGMYGFLGGGGMAAILFLLYFLARGKI